MVVPDCQQYSYTHISGPSLPLKWVLPEMEELLACCLEPPCTPPNENGGVGNCSVGDFRAPQLEEEASHQNPLTPLPKNHQGSEPERSCQPPDPLAPCAWRPDLSEGWLANASSCENLGKSKKSVKDPRSIWGNYVFFV